MNTFHVTVTRITEILEHSNADVLEIAKLEDLDWSLVVRKDLYRPGDKVVYFPIDTVLPVEVSDRFEVTTYLSKGRVRCAKLRGTPSFGLVVTPDDPRWEIGRDVAEHYGATKYEPPFRPGMEDMEKEHPLFIKYTDIENMRHYPDIIRPNEEVVVTEKLHGTNCRIGIIESEFMAGSKTKRRKKPEECDSCKAKKGLYWLPYRIEAVKNLLNHLYTGLTHKQVILFGEVYGYKVQSLHYGLTKEPGFAAFDLFIDGKYVNYDYFAKLCARFGVPTVPLVARIPFDLDKIRELSEGETLLEDSHIREGVVVKPVIEESDLLFGRVILKYVSEKYLLKKSKKKGAISDFAEE